MNKDFLTPTFQALADPTRRAILNKLSQGKTNVTELAEPFLKEMSLPAVTKHLKVLEKAGLISKTKEAQWRTCEINAAPLKEATDWIEQYRTFWEESFDRLDLYLQELQKKPIKKQKKKGAKHVRKAKTK